MKSAFSIGVPKISTSKTGPVISYDLLPRHEMVFARDIWDVRDLPGANITPGHNNHTINFTQAPLTYRSLIKSYCRIKLAELSWDSVMCIARELRVFCTFYEERFPEYKDFKDLSRADIESFIIYLNNKPSTSGKNKGETLSRKAQWAILRALTNFLLYLQRTEHIAAPAKSVTKLIWPEDGVRTGKRAEWSINDDKFIPESVLEQLDQHLDKLSETFFPIVVILRASGWRISDVLNLKWDKALDITRNPLNPDEKRYWLVGDISKTGVRNHRIPIEAQVAEVIKQQAQIIKLMYTETLNPKRHLFPAAHKGRHGYAINSGTVRVALNTLARNYNIRDDNGEIFNFKTHAFRHTKAVELINKGMLLIHVQKWLAHSSPEMTLTYAKVLDNTMHDAWVKTIDDGVVVLKDGKATKIDVQTLMSDPLIEWERIKQNMDAIALPNGYCMKPNRMTCPVSEMPCHVCNHFCTTPQHLPQFEEQAKHIKEIIERGEEVGNEQWVDKNKKILAPIENIITVLETGNLHHPAGKSRRENTNE